MNPRLFLVSAILITLLEGCWNPFHPPLREGALYVVPATPEQVIENLQRAYMSRDLEGYLACLDPDSFRFVFDAREDSIQEILREYWGLDSLVWGYTEEKLSAQELFASVDQINLTLVLRGRTTDSTGTRVYLLYDYLLTLEPPPPGAEMAEGRALFLLVRNPEDHYWRIREWQDYTLSPTSPLPKN